MSTTSKKVSAVIPFYGDPSDTLELIGQLSSQTIADDIEIIVSDDCSPTPFPEITGVKVVRRETNGGFGANVNSAVAATNGTWLFILNSDLSLPTDFVENATKTAESLGDVILAPQILGHDGKGQAVGRDFPKTRHIVWEWMTPFARIRHKNVWQEMVGHDLACETGKTVDVDWVMGACLILRTSTFRRVGGMDERYFMNSEEVDLQRRLRTLGVRRIFDGNLVVEHIGGASSGDQTRRRQWVTNSRFIYADKWNESRYLGKCMKMATYFNYGFNKIRSFRNPDVAAEDTKRIELEIINNAQAKARSVRSEYGRKQ